MPPTWPDQIKGGEYVALPGDDLAVVQIHDRRQAQLPRSTLYLITFATHYSMIYPALAVGNSNSANAKHTSQDHKYSRPREDNT